MHDYLETNHPPRNRGERKHTGTHFPALGADLVREDQAGLHADCGHLTGQAIRIYSTDGSRTLCLDCWRSQRRFSASIRRYSYAGIAVRRSDMNEPASERFSADTATSATVVPQVKAYEDRTRAYLNAGAMQSRSVRHKPIWADAPAKQTKVLLYSHDTYGLGHLRRNLAIAEQLLKHTSPFSVLLLTGSPVITTWPLPVGLKVQSLPPVVKVAAEKYASRDNDEIFPMVKGYREALIMKSVIHYRPDVILIDHAPAGMNGELLAALSLVRREMPDTRIVLGLRDIIDDPKVVRALWKEQEIYALLDRVYHNVLVYSSRSLFDVVREYHLPERIAAKICYCGYITRDSRSAEPAPSAAHAHPPTLQAKQPIILVTAGGGGDGHFMMDAYVRALDQMPDGFAQSIVVTGPLMPTHERETLERAVAQRSDVKIIACATDMIDLMQHADLIIAMGGYNTSAEILATGKPAIVVPRAAPRAEQRMRAELLAKLGLLWAVQPDQDLTAHLSALIPSILSGTLPPRQTGGAVDLGGAHRVCAVLEQLTGTRLDARESLS